MNYRLILQTIGKILLIEALLLIFPLIVNFIYQEGNLFAFALTISILMVVGTLLMMVKPKNKSMFIREGFVIVGLAWIVMSLFGALPFTLSGPNSVDYCSKGLAITNIMVGDWWSFSGLLKCQQK